MNTRAIEGVIFDWAGTTVDFGCFAPLDVFCTIFEKYGVPVTAEEAREPMGKLKWDHIKAMLHQPRICKEWKNRYNHAPTDTDVVQLYSEFEPFLLGLLPDYCTPIEGVLPAIEHLRSMGIKIGSTTGYTRKMIQIVAEGAAQKGYTPDHIVSSDECKAGRPAPWMIYHNCEALDLWHLSRVIKVGDTISDIQEGLNASVWSVGVVIGSSLMGLTEEQYKGLSISEKDTMIRHCTSKFEEAGAHFVIRSMHELPNLIQKINTLLADGILPSTVKNKKEV